MLVRGNFVRIMTKVNDQSFKVELQYGLSKSLREKNINMIRLTLKKVVPYSDIKASDLGLFLLYKA